MDPNPPHHFEKLPDPVPADDHRAEWLRFTVGEVVSVGGVDFVVRKITKKDLVLRPKRAD